MAAAIRSSMPNAITDDDAWFVRNQLTPPTVRGGDLPQLPPMCGGARLGFAAPGVDHTVAFYGSLAVVFDARGEALGAFDLGAYGLDPRYGAVVDGVLYVSHAHRTYASATSGANGYITAIELAIADVGPHVYVGDLSDDIAVQHARPPGDPDRDLLDLERVSAPDGAPTDRDRGRARDGEATRALDRFAS